MSDLDRRIATTALGLTPEYMDRQDEWFAWHPVRLGALGTGRMVWLKRVWRDRCMGVTIYQDLEMVRGNRARVENMTCR